MYVHCCSPFFSSLPAQDAEGSSHQIKQFHYTGWPMEGVPNSAIGLLDIREQVEKWQRNSGDKPIVVHCRYVQQNNHPFNCNTANSFFFFNDGFI